MANTDYRLMQIIEDIKDLAEGINQNDKDLRGLQVAYAEALSVIQEKLTDEEKKRYKLDFDIEEEYF